MCVFSSRRFATVLAAIPLTAVSLTGCSQVVEVFGPRPDAELVQLAQQAEADASTLDDEQATALRDKQARELYDEILRVCGVDPEGQSPESCTVDRSINEATGATSLAQSGEEMARFVAENRAKLPEDSIDLVVSHVVDTLAATDVSLPENLGEITDEQDLQAAQAMLEREYALQYGLGLASAYADDGLQQRIDMLNDTSQDRVTALTLLGADQPEDSALAAGYEFQELESPTTTVAATALVDELEANLVGQWRTTAAEASSAEWQYAASHFAAHAQRGE